jgi:hypothetical protein
VQAAGQFHGHVVEALFGISEHVLDNVAAFDPADDVFNAPPDARNEPIPRPSDLLTIGRAIRN